jgi:hypothetical protein
MWCTLILIGDYIYLHGLERPYSLTKVCHSPLGALPARSAAASTFLGAPFQVLQLSKKSCAFPQSRQRKPNSESLLQGQTWFLYGALHGFETLRHINYIFEWPLDFGWCSGGSGAGARRLIMAVWFSARNE